GIRHPLVTGVQTCALPIFPAGFPPDFSGYDVATRDVEGPGLAAARRFLARIPGALAAGRSAPAPGEEAAEPDPNEGSNAWALARSEERRVGKEGKARRAR